MSGGGIKPHPRSPLTLTAPGQTLGNATPYRKKSANRQSRGSQKKGNWLPQTESVEVKKHHSVKGGYLSPVRHKRHLSLTSLLYIFVHNFERIRVYILVGLSSVAVSVVSL